MPFDAGGQYTLPPGYEAVAGQTILPSQHNPPLQDIGSALSLAFLRDGRAAMTGPTNMGGNQIQNVAPGVLPSDVATVSQLSGGGGGGGGGNVPAGAVLYGAWPPTEIPGGWLHANGAIIPRTTYAALFVAIGTRFGSGDGATTFQLPDLRGVAIRGLDSGKGYDSGRAFGSYQADDFGSHTHGGSTATAGSHTHDGTAATAGSHTHTATETIAGDHTHFLSLDNNGAHKHTATLTTDGSHQHSYQALGSTGLPGAAAGSGYTNVSANTGTAGSHTHIASLSTDGLHTHTGTLSTAGAHTHTITVFSAGDHTHSLTIAASGTHTHTLSITNTGGSETRMKNVALTPIIKT